MIAVRPLDPQSEAAQTLIAELDAYLAGLYPPESNYLASPAELAGEDACFLAAYAEDYLVGCGAVKILSDGYAEIKRLYVRPIARGAGAGGRLLAALEAFAAARGCRLMRLETGVHQAAALALFSRSGYRPIGPYGAYATDDPLSVFMEKVLP